MRLKELLPNIEFKENIGELLARGICRDTRILKKEELFFIIEGKTFDIFSLLRGIETKPVAFVADTEKKDLVSSIIKKKPVIFVENIERQFKTAIDNFYPLKMEDLKLIGITGTNGKTTTAHLIHYLLNNFHAGCALIGTVYYLLGSKKIRASYTTPDYLYLRKLLYNIKDKNINYIIMEVSSHSIDQSRVGGINFSQCIFTNLTRDHLDYHHTIDEYFSVKKRFFLNNTQAASFINIDDDYGKIIFSQFKGEKYSYALSPSADYSALDCTLSKKGVEFILENKTENIKVRVKSLLLGKYNIYNVLAALASVHYLGFSLNEAARLVSSFKAVEGRLKEVDNDIFIDYAHSPDSLRSVIDTLYDIGYKNIITVFGCGGNRDKGKREIMGSIASRLATFSFITSDNPRDEDPRQICSQIEKGFEGKNYKIVIDRKDAIKEALELKSNYNESAVLIAGKGHEDYQIIKGEKFPFKDRLVVEEILKDRVESRE